MKSKFASSILLSILLIGGGNVVAQGNNNEQTLEKNKETVRRLFEDFLNTGKVESLDQIIAEEYVGLACKKGPSAFAEMIEEFRISFPDIRWSVEELIAEDDRVVTRWHWQGTYESSFRSFPASQEQITNQGIAIFWLKDDKIVAAWIQPDWSSVRLGNGLGGFNGDCNADVAAATTFSSVYVPFGQAGGLGPATSTVAEELNNVAAGDADMDGKSDLASSNGDPDTTAPTVICESPDHRWHNSDVNLTCTADDSGSGLANPADATFTLSTNVAPGTQTSDAVTSTKTVCDVAGNCATADVFYSNNVDKRAPDIQVIAPVVTYLLNQPVQSNFSCSDGSGSGVRSCAGSVATGTLIDTAAVGSKTFSVTATDVVGNVAGSSTQYGVTYKIFILYETSQIFNAKAKLQIKIQLQNVSGRNQSSAAISVDAIRVTPRGNPEVTSKTAGGTFSFDAALAFPGSAPGGGYKYTLDTSGLAPGAYDLVFGVFNDPILHTAPFTIK